jgi:DNA-binding transcriptional MocR family regulator
MPTIQSPTARTMPLQRRRDIASVLEQIGGSLIEDDVYGFLADRAIPPISCLIPNRSIYVMSFSKILELGLRLGAMRVPVGLVDAAALAMRATSWTASPLIAELVSQLIASGQMAELSAAVREESRARRAIFHEIFGGMPTRSEPGGYHVWLPLPADRDPTDLFIAARGRGILVTPPGFAVGEVEERGLRLCLGGPENQDALRTALETVKRLVTRSARPHILVT